MSLTPRIIFQDNELLVLDKPAGMTVNKAESAKELTVQEWVENSYKLQVTSYELENEMVRNFVARAGIVHRLDKDTSGVLLVAKTLEAMVALQAQFKQRQIQKTYLALVHGWVSPEEGQISAAISRNPFERRKFGVFLGGRESTTDYRVVKTFDNPRLGQYSLVEAYPKTGRTHQIRVHFKFINHPVVADELYAGRKTSRNDKKWCPRHFLHAYKIELTHPVSQRQVDFVAPLPLELEEALAKL